MIDKGRVVVKVAFKIIFEGELTTPGLPGTLTILALKFPGTVPGTLERLVTLPGDVFLRTYTHGKES